MNIANNRLKKLHELSLLLSGEPDDICRQIALMIGDFFNVRAIVITEIRDQEIHLLCANIEGKISMNVAHYPLQETPCARVKIEDDYQFIEQVSDHFPEIEFLKKHAGCSYYGVPSIDSHGKLIGTTCLLNDKPGKPDKEDQQLLRIFSQRIAMELERKRKLEQQGSTEKQLVDTQQQLYNLSNISPVGIFRTDAKGQCFYVNERWCELTGITATEAQGDGWNKSIHADDREQVFAAWANSAAQGSPFELEFRFQKNNGDINWVLSKAVAERDEQGEISGYIGSATDITKHKVLEQALREKETWLLEAQKVAHLGHWNWDLNSGELNWSDEHFRIFGLEPQAAAPNFIDFVHPDDQTTAKQAIKEAMTENNYSLDHRIILPNDEVRTIHGQGEVSYDDDGKAIRMVGTVQDITDRKRIEEGLSALSSIHATENMQEFYRDCARNLARIYNARYAFVGLFSKDTTTAITTQAVWAGDDFAPNFEYELAGTPCADVLDQKKALIPKDATKLYPEDTLLDDLKVESYFGAPLVSKSGETLGLVSVLDIKPMRVDLWEESVLGLFAQRIASRIKHDDAEQKLQRSEQELRMIFANMQDTCYRTDKKGVITFISASCEKLLGYSTQELIGTTLTDYYLEPERRQKLIQLLNRDGSVLNFEAPLKHKNGSIIWVSTNAQYYRDKEGNILGVEGATRDITLQRKSATEMKKMSSALEQSADMVMITDKEGIVEYVNPAFERISGYTKSDVIGQQSSIMYSGKQDDAYYKNLWKTILKDQVFSDVLINRKKDGSTFYEEKSITSIKDDKGKITHFVATGRDITERMKSEERLSFMAHHDALTELPNRALFLDRLRQSLAHAERYNHKVAILFFDLDRFKNINDSLGHEVGDRVLVQMGERLSTLTRQGDTLARFGGDEFAILLNDISENQDASILADKILISLQEAFYVNKHELFISASIGISIFPDDGTDYNVLMKNADTAMYRAKELGKNNHQFYSADMSAKAFLRLNLENSLRAALEREEYVLYYQPQIDIANDKIVGMEALIRWQHPELGIVAPTDFIPLLEETGLIDKVGDWIIDQACKDMQKWHQAGFSEVGVSINISGRQFHAQGFIEHLREHINTYQIEPHQIELEITESTLMEDSQSTINSLDTLEKMGFKIAIDDFGTGYSSLSYLRRFKVDTLKIDQSFIRDVLNDSDNAAITTAIIAMAHSLKLKVVAEGVEQYAQLEFIKQSYCHLAQGYLFSRPLPFDQALELLYAKKSGWHITA